MKGRRAIFHAKGSQKKAEVVTLISDKLELKTKTVIRGIEGYCIILKRSILPEDLTIVNIYAPIMGATNYIIGQLLPDEESYLYLYGNCRGS